MAITLDEIIAALRGTHVFGGLNPTALGELAALCVSRSIRRDQYLMYQGDPVDHLFVVVDGGQSTVTSEDGPP